MRGLSCLRLVSFDPLRTLDLDGVHPLKPEEWFAARELVRAADFVLFPEYWQVNPLVYAWKKRIFPSVNSFHLGHDKVEMTRALQALVPQNVPETSILGSNPLAEERILAAFNFPFVAKTVRSSMGQGVYLIEDLAGLRRYLGENRVAYVQEYLPINRDVRVVFIGKRVVTAYWRQGAEGMFHNNVAQGASVSFDDIPKQVLELVEHVALTLGIDHAGFDVAMVGNHPYLLEFNVRFGTQTLNARGIRVGPLIRQYLESQLFPPFAPRTPAWPRAV